MSERGVAEPFLISLAVLELVVDAARRTPVLVSLDDMHWMDQSSLDTLGFLARRLAGERIVLVASTRTSAPSVVDGPSIIRLPVEGLPEPAAGVLLDRTSPNLPPSMRAQILRESAGNPLALLEFPLAVSGFRSSSTLVADDLPMTLRLERAFAGRLRTLPPATEMALVVAAFNDSGDLGEILAATGLITGNIIGVAGLQPAIDAGLIRSDAPGVQFRHPLVRSAIRQSAPLAERVAVHAALARVLTSDRDRASWHRAEAADAPDESIAAALEEVVSANYCGRSPLAAARTDVSRCERTERRSLARRFLGTVEFFNWLHLMRSVFVYL